MMYYYVVMFTSLMQLELLAPTPGNLKGTFEVEKGAHQKCPVIVFAL